MKAYFLLLMFLCQQYQVSGYSCWTCSSYSYFYGEPARQTKCYDRPTELTALRCSNTEYCRTQLRVQRGLPSTVVRSCQSPNSDHDYRSTSVPDATKCQETSTNLFDCYLSCNSENCNAKATTLLKTCPNNCTYPSGGYCDYLTGKCNCNSGNSGDDCSSKKYLSCIQCTEEMDSNCAKASSGLPLGSQCPNTYSYCVTSKTTTISRDTGAIVRSVVTRGCSNSSTMGCSMTDISASPPLPNYIQYTCSESCATDNCNTATPEKPVALSCVVCNGVYGCATHTWLTSCSAEEKYCYSTVEYIIGKEGTSEYRLLSVKRGCSAVKSPSTGCNSKAISGLTISKVTCHENCDTSGCNTGWPARPKCVQCDGTKTQTSFSRCLKSFPTEATACLRPYHEHCTTTTTTTSVEDNKGLGSVTVYRSCSQHEENENCNSTSIVGVMTKTCSGTCSKTGCNHGSMPKAGVALLLMSFLAAMFL